MSIQQPPFKFNLGDWAHIVDSCSTGQVRARRDGIGFPNEYLLMFNRAGEIPRQEWWCEDQLTHGIRPDTYGDNIRRYQEYRCQRREQQKSPPELASASAS